MREEHEAGRQHDEGLRNSEEDLETRNLNRVRKGYFGVEPARDDEDWGKKTFVRVCRY